MNLQIIHSQWLQIASLLLFGIITLIWIICVCPFKHKIHTILMIASQIFLIIGVILIATLNQEGLGAETIESVGDLVMWMFLSEAIAFMLIQFGETIYDIFEYIKKCRKDNTTQKEIRQKEEDEIVEASSTRQPGFTLSSIQTLQTK